MLNHDELIQKYNTQKEKHQTKLDDLSYKILTIERRKKKAEDKKHKAECVKKPTKKISDKKK